ncbi:cupin domain-containing protein [Pseudomarimonas arenosa]|uniref:Cupin domain-containing protein n=1 Tax=Pseudomarimonas arenosa TaxID=2774145 RepID=A0AAW3ZE85_9GAMM|nr:cupin domain-containing protein [Pseudomarimonas arenosa]MBD8524503.1 cupin domain-containing protein [Pseudomarimonas arenosa]
MKPVINIDQVNCQTIMALKPNAPAKYQGARLGPISPLIGAQKLGYNLTELPPGKAAFPAHNHYGNEEMFYIIAGQGELRVGEQRIPLRAGDVIACPPGGPETAHQIYNTSSSADLRYLAVSTAISPDYVQYPDSGKSGAAVVLGRDEKGIPKAVRLMNRETDNLDYWDGE